MIPVEVKALDCSADDGLFGLRLDCGHPIRARAVVVASGARYRRPPIANLPEFDGRGVWYWASPVEGRLCAGEEVILVGGGNSAGQAAVYLSGHAAKVRMMVRGRDLADSMSRYLIDRIAATPNIELMTETELVALEGTPASGLERVRWRNKRNGEETTGEIRNVFCSSAQTRPRAGWMGAAWSSTRPALSSPAPIARKAASARSCRSNRISGVCSPLATSAQGRSNAIGGAIGEGAQVVQSLHSFLADAAAPTLAAPISRSGNQAISMSSQNPIQ